MVGSSEKLRLKKLLSEAIVLLCKNGLPFSDHFCLEALIGVTLGENEVVLFSITETIETAVPGSSEGCEVEESAQDVAKPRKLQQTRPLRQTDDIVLDGDNGKSYLPIEDAESGVECKAVVKHTGLRKVSTKQASASKGSVTSGANQFDSFNSSNPNDSRLNLKRERSEAFSESRAVNVKSEDSLQNSDTDHGADHYDNNGRLVKLETAWSDEARDDDGCIYVQSDEDYDEATGGEHYAEGDENYGETEGWGVKEENDYGYEEYDEREAEGAGYDPGPSTSYDVTAMPMQPRRRGAGNKMGFGSTRRSGPRPSKRQRIQAPADEIDTSQAWYNTDPMNRVVVQQRFNCPMCTKSFLRRDAVKDHINGFHLRKKNCYCNVCGEGFIWRKMLRDHRNKPGACHLAK